MKLIIAPYIEKLPYGMNKLFLAGSIEMDTAEKWQDRVIASLKKEHVVIFNPRREEWDASWEQTMDDPNFKDQVTWELDHLDKSNMVMFYFDPKTKSPVTLLELGLIANSPHEPKVFVCCPHGFWRRGNIEAVCARKNIRLYDNLDETIGAIKWNLSKQNLT